MFKLPKIPNAVERRASWEAHLEAVDQVRNIKIQLIFINFYLTTSFFYHK